MTVLAERTCPTCGKPVTVTTRNPNRRYCSPPCKALGWRRRAKGLPENGDRTTPNGVTNYVTESAPNAIANGANGANALNAVANGANGADAVANRAGASTVAPCPHCHRPISLLTLLVPPAAAHVTPPPPPTWPSDRRTP